MEMQFQPLETQENICVVQLSDGGGGEKRGVRKSLEKMVNDETKA